MPIRTGLSHLSIERLNQILRVCHTTPFRVYNFIARHTSTTSMASSSQDVTPCATPDSEKVFVQISPKGDMLTISFKYNTQNGSRFFNLSRKSDEPLSASLERIKLNILKMKHKNKTRSREQSETSLMEHDLRILIDGSGLNPDQKTNVEAWVDGATLDLGDRTYTISRNNPEICKLRLPSCIMTDCTTMPIIKFQNCSLETTRYVWHRLISPNEFKSLQPSTDPSLVEFDGRSHWLQVHEGLTYTPTMDDVNHYIRLSCHPSDGTKQGMIRSVVSEKPVEIGPANCPFEKRFEYTKASLDEPNQFRVVSYNVLADIYSDSDYSRTSLFAHCPSFALDSDYRMPLLMKELRGYNADIICTQEMDKKLFESNYELFFKIMSNLSGLFSPKRSMGEGEAIFFRNDKFELIESHHAHLASIIEPEMMDTSDPGPLGCMTSELYASRNKQPIFHDLNSSDANLCLKSFDDIREVVRLNASLKPRATNRHTILQIALLKFKGVPNKYLLVGNTHLYFMPTADDVRLVQGAICLRYLNYLKSHYTEKLTSTSDGQPVSIGVVFCGDFNSGPEDGVYKLATSGRVDRTEPDWSSDPQVPNEGVELINRLVLKSAYQNIQYTNYTPQFKGCLDYIFYEGEVINCEQIVPLPPDEELATYDGLPNEFFPSDHLALIADLSMKPIR